MLSLPASPIWAPRADLYRTATGWLIKLDLAGVGREDVEVALEGKTVRVAGVRRDRSFAKDCVPYSIEISYSRFERIFELPEEPQQVSVTIQQEVGMVVIRLEEARRD